MNETLARLYGTGMSKTASDASAEAGQELDLTQISAADFLRLVEEQEAAEKTAGEGLDLSQMSAQELIDLAEELGEQESDNSEVIEKMAQSGDLAYWDSAGRIMAHAYAQELEKVSSADLPDVIDTSDLTAEDLLALVESGEYELVKEAASFAGMKESAKTLLKRVADKGSAAASAVASKGREAGAQLSSVAKAEQARSAAGKLKRWAQMAGGSGGTMAGVRKMMQGGGSPGARRELRNLAAGSAKTGLLYGGGAAAALGGLAGGKALADKYKSRR